MSAGTVVAYQRAVNEIRRRVETVAVDLWSRLGGLSDEQIARYVAAMVPTMSGAEAATARLVAGYLSTLSLQDTGVRFPYQLDLDEIIGEQLRGVPPSRVYARPGVDARTVVKNGRPTGEAMLFAGHRARQLASTDVMLAQRAATIQLLGQDTRIVGYRRVIGQDSCAFCAAVSTQRYRTDQLMPIHTNCVVGDTVVDGPGTLGASRRGYEGEAVTIGTAAGNFLTITPNHPVLTDVGWVPAGLVKEGDHVLSSSSGQRIVGGVPHENEVPARIEDRFRALRVAGLVRVPLTAEDFHGDVGGGQVDVVDVHSDFGAALHAERQQIEAEALLASGRGHAAALTCESALAPLLPGMGTAPVGGLSSGSLAATLSSSHSLGAHTSGIALAPQRHSRLLEVSTDDGPVHAEGVSEGEFGRTAEIAGGYLLGGQGNDPAVTRFDPASVEFSGEGLVVYASLGRRLGDRLAGQVERDRVVLVSRVDLSSCHVYNLHTTEGWYAANGIIVSNCDCGVAPIYGTEDPGRVANSELLEQIKAEGGPEYWKEKGWGVDQDGAIRQRRDVPVLGDDGQPLRTSSGKVRTRMELGDPVKPVVKTHGELGPVLWDPEHSFTGPSDI